MTLFPGVIARIFLHNEVVISIPIETEHIRLSQLLKLANVVMDGAEAKFRIGNKEVRVNGEVEVRRGRKLRNGDLVEFEGETYRIAALESAGQ